MLIEAALSKQRILEIYLNIAQFGPHHYGIHQASKWAFNVSPDKITRNQAAALAAVLPNPAQYSATQPTRYLKSRQKWISKQMRQLGGKAFLDQLDRPKVASVDET